MRILIEIKEQAIQLSLIRKEKQIDILEFSGNHNLSEILLGKIDELMVKNELKFSDIKKMTVKSNIPDNLTTVRIAKIVAKTFNFSKDVN
ncbi:MAG TPA: hypothetical protein DDY52_04240 [Candidatus Moranbacteria bacterium]|nr:MAG: hypothetical protein UR51_C0011G0026 [Candidatus Moranbacteria bacterium GW2011_GWF1_34_10]HBI17324.1 hypothetical protein [Candidatus Moranbacteria bacterium]